MKTRNRMIMLALAAVSLLVLLCAAYSGSAEKPAQISPAMATPAPETTQPPEAAEEPEVVETPVFHEIPTAAAEPESAEDAENNTDSTAGESSAAAVTADSSDYTVTAVSDAIPESPAENSGNIESAPADDEPAAVEAEPEDEYVILENGECVKVVECTGPAAEEEQEEYAVTESITIH